MDPARLPVARELFAQWQRARGHRSEPASRPFSRGWEELLEAAGLRSAPERGEAEHDARSLAAEGWLDLQPVPYKPHLLARVRLPLEAEARWGAAFGFVAPTDDEARQIAAHPWAPALAFVRTARTQVPFAELRQLDAFLKGAPQARPVVPIKERSLEIFGDEKRLDTLAGSVLFRSPDRLDLREHLRCESIGVPLAWRRGPVAAAAGPLLVIENAATWHSYCRWNAVRREFSAVVYGDGNRFVDGIAYLPDLFAELGGRRPVHYFGDLDPPGLRIPQEAAARAKTPITPHLWSYRQLLARGADRVQAWDSDPGTEALCEWLGELAEPARRLFVAHRRLAQEHLGWEFLCEPAGDADGSRD
jgi:hypothetical protein